jgi:hypothetical protein
MRIGATGNGKPAGEVSAPRVRYVTADTPDALTAEQTQALRRLSRRAAKITDPLDAELWASQALGRMWLLREAASDAGASDWQFALGAPVARQLARVGGSGAKGLLLAWGTLAEGRFRKLCEELASGLRDAPTPPWAAQLGAVELAHAASDKRPGEGEVVVISVCRKPPPAPQGPGCQPPASEWASGTADGSASAGSELCAAFSLLAYIDECLGKIARLLALGPSLDELAGPGGRDRAPEAAGLSLTPITVRQACLRIRAAIRRTDAAPVTWVEEDFADLRALALHQLAAGLAGRVRGRGLQA